MRKIAEWIKHHKLWTSLILLGIFFLPILFIHLLFKVEKGPTWLQAKWDAGDVLTYVAGFEAFIGTVSLGALSLWQNEQIHNEHIESLEPCLSMQLVSIKHRLCLIIENTGAIEAKEISLTIQSISGNGDKTDLINNGVFGPVFELYPKETIQKEIAYSSENITTSIFPQVKIHVSYLRPDINRRKDFERTVTYNTAYSKKILADINYDNRMMESKVGAIASAAVRTANYLDGCQLTTHDEISVLAERSIRNDLVEALTTGKTRPIADRSTILHHDLPEES